MKTDEDTTVDGWTMMTVGVSKMTTVNGRTTCKETGRQIYSMINGHVQKRTSEKKFAKDLTGSIFTLFVGYSCLKGHSERDFSVLYLGRWPTQTPL